MQDARRDYRLAISTIGHYGCPTIEWKIHQAAGELAGRLKDNTSRDQQLGRARAIVKSLADSVHDGRLRQTFLSSKPIRNLHL